jgi:hypothetical protein
MDLSHETHQEAPSPPHTRLRTPDASARCEMAAALRPVPALVRWARPLLASNVSLLLFHPMLDPDY